MHGNHKRDIFQFLTNANICTIAIMINKPDISKPYLFLICREMYIVFVQKHSSSTYNCC